jgi:hypothetical protein
MDSQTVLAAAPLAALSGLLLLLALIDLLGRPAAAVAGHKAVWAIALLLTPIGPILYLWMGRRPNREDDPRSP